jgi:hypothetical protein
LCAQRDPAQTQLGQFFTLSSAARRRRESSFLIAFAPIFQPSMAS